MPPIDWIDIAKRTWAFRYWIAYNILDKFEHIDARLITSDEEHPYYVEEYELYGWEPVFLSYLERRAACLKENATKGVRTDAEHAVH